MFIIAWFYWRVYALVWWCALPFLHRRLNRKYSNYPHYLENTRQRFGDIGNCFGSDFNNGIDRPLWIHAASVGEVLTVAPLVSMIQKNYPALAIIITTTTPTGAAQVERSLSSVSHAYLPYDLSRFQRRFVKRLQPSVFIVVETELWPTMIRMASQQCPVIVFNARMSAASAKQYLRFAPMTKTLFARLSMVLAQTEAEQQRFGQLGAANTLVTGSSKLDFRVTDPMAEKASQFKNTLGGRPVLIAASTHKGEEAQILSAFAAIKKQCKNTLLLLVPRHIERKSEVIGLFNAFDYHCFSDQKPMGESVDILLVDVIGELSWLYGVADIAFVGGSLIAHGGQNMVEPASWSLPIIVGPHTHNFTALAEGLSEVGGLSVVDSGNELARVAALLLNNQDARVSQGALNKAFVEHHKGALDRQYQVIMPFLDELP